MATEFSLKLYQTIYVTKSLSLKKKKKKKRDPVLMLFFLFILISMQKIQKMSIYTQLKWHTTPYL